MACSASAKCKPISERAPVVLLFKEICFTAGDGGELIPPHRFALGCACIQPARPHMEVESSQGMQLLTKESVVVASAGPTLKKAWAG